MKTINDFFEASIKGTINDEENPLFIFQGVPTSVLIDLKNGVFDVAKLIDHQIAARGLDAEGTWVGWGKANSIHEVNSETVIKPETK